MLVRRRQIVACAALLPALSLARAEVPGLSKPVRLLVPFAPGGGTDSTARLLALYLSPLLGQPIVVENRTGAGGNIATEAAARAPADGHTLVMLTNGQLIANPLGMHMSFDPAKEITVLGRVTWAPMVLVVPKASPYTTIEQFLAGARQARGGINYGSAGIGTPQHLGMEQLKYVAGFDATHVAYKGSGPALLDLLSGKIDVIMESSSASAPYIRSGALRPLAVTSDKPVADLPGVPTLDSHVHGLLVSSWTAVGAPAGIPPALAQALESALQRSVTDADFARKLRERGTYASWLGAADMRAAIEAERAVTADVMHRADIRFDS